MENKFWKKIWAKRESGLTAVRLNRDPPVFHYMYLSVLSKVCTRPNNIHSNFPDWHLFNSKRGKINTMKWRKGIHSCPGIMTLLLWQFLVETADIAELMSASIRVIITCSKGFSQWHHWDSLTSWQYHHQFDSWGGTENCCFFFFLLQGSQFPSKFYIVICETPLYECMVVWILK